MWIVTTGDDTSGQTAEPHLYTCSKDSLQHLTDLDVTKSCTPPSTHAIFDDGQYPQQYNLVAGRITGFKFAVRDGGADSRKGNIDGWIVFQEESAGKERVHSGKGSGRDGTRWQRRANDGKEGGKYISEGYG
jgi:hypothetical protein